MKDIYRREQEDGPGVPEAVPRLLQRVLDELGAGAVDRIWVFPPLVDGRSESGLLAVSRYAGGDDPERRVLATFPYTAERTGKGLTVEGELAEQGEAPLDRLPRVMEGVVARTEKDLGEPRELELEGDEDRFLEILATFEASLLDPELPPLRTAEPGADVQAAPGPDEDPVASAAFLEAPDPEPSTGDDELFDLYTPEPAP